MNKFLLTFIVLLLFTTEASAEEIFDVNGETHIMTESINIEINGEKIEFEEPIYIYKSRTIVPIKFLFNELGFDVLWFESERKVIATRGEKTLEIIIDKPEIVVNGNIIISDVNPVIINNRTYIPLNIVATSTGAVVTWENETRTVFVEEKLDHLNLFYGRSSYNNFKNIKDNHEFENVNTVSYAWSKIEITEGIVSLNTSSINNNLMYFPEGFEEVIIEEVQKKLLNIYFDDDYEKMFAQKEKIITEIVKIINKPRLSNPKFDGIVIDFEGMEVKYFEEYLNFIISLKSKLGDKLLYAAIQPRDEYDYKSLVKQVDRLILMLHDYETKDKTIITINNQFINQPLTPIERIKTDLDKILENIDSFSDRSKISLQVSLAVVQWQEIESHVSKRLTPSYKLLISRMEKLKEDNFKYDEFSENPYLVYIDEESRNNTIWYENQVSIEKKIQLIKKYGLGGISLWQIANIPEIEIKEGETPDLQQDFKLNIWETILKNY